MTPSIVIAGGGTAGHVYPGLALADALRAMRSDVRIAFVGTKRGIEGEAVPAAGYALHLIDVIPWSKPLGAKRYLAPFSLAGATRSASRILRSERATVVVGMGGYASIPVVLAARAARIPIVLHEQNAIPGIANVIGARVTRNIALVFEDARARFPATATIRVVGNPIRSVIATLDRDGQREKARLTLDLDPAKQTLIIFGGSLGAARLNEAGVALAERWKDRGDIQAVLVTGPAHRDAIAARLPHGGSVHVRGFLDRMELAYAAADLVVARAGAATIAELAATGTPSVLVPYPYARADHQAANAHALERAGGAVVVRDDDSAPREIATLAEDLLSNRQQLDAMSKGAKSFGKPDAAHDFASWVLELAGER